MERQCSRREPGNLIAQPKIDLEPALLPPAGQQPTGLAAVRPACYGAVWLEIDEIRFCGLVEQFLG